MEYRSLGKTNLKISRLGIGLVKIGEAEMLTQLDKSNLLLNTALDNGINFLDTAACYGNSEEVISAIKPKIDLLLLDPSRKGCDEKLLENLILNPVKNIIYISCEPKTLGRDLNLLTQNSKYKIISINPIDLFPNTHHVESITLLKLNK